MPTRPVPPPPRARPFSLPFAYVPGGYVPPMPTRKPPPLPTIVQDTPWRPIDPDMVEAIRGVLGNHLVPEVISEVVDFVLYY